MNKVVKETVRVLGYIALAIVIAELEFRLKRDRLESVKTTKEEK